MQTKFQFNPAKTYIEIPREIIDELNLNNLPFSRKQKLVAEIQARMDEKLQNVVLAALSDEIVLQELESIFAADEDVNVEDLLLYLFRAIPDFPEKWETECNFLLKEFIQP